MQIYGQSQYKQMDITTADRGKLVVLLYEGAINFLKMAKKCIHERNMEGKGTYINRAHDIILELSYSLNMEDGGQIAKDLRSLYWFMEKHLVRAKIERDGTQKIDEVISMLSTLNEAWKEILNKPEVRSLKNVDSPIQAGLSRGITV